jgi:hypothetical protein
VNSLSVFAALQGPLVSALLLLSVAAKVRMGRSGFERTAFLQLLRRLRPGGNSAQQVAVWVALASVEASLSVALALGFAPIAIGTAVGVFFLLAAAYLAWAVRNEHGSSCGCFSDRVSVNRTSVWRALCISAAAAGYAIGGQDIWRASQRSASVAILVLASVAECIFLFALSAELVSSTRLMASGTLRMASERRVGLEAFRSATAQVLVEGTDFWSRFVLPAAGGAHIAVRDTWAAGAWRYHEYAGVWFGEPATIVTAVLMRDRFPTWRLVVSVESSLREGRIVAACDSEAEEERLAKQRKNDQPASAPSATGIAATS